MDRNNIVENIIEQANDRIEKFKPIEAIGVNIGWSNGHLSQLRVAAKPLSDNPQRLPYTDKPMIFEKQNTSMQSFYFVIGEIEDAIKLREKTEKMVDFCINHYVMKLEEDKAKIEKAIGGLNQELMFNASVEYGIDGINYNGTKNPIIS